jgi:hypothetical protein
MPWRRRREGKVLTLAALMLVPLSAITALALDLGQIAFVRNELQNAADAAALAGTMRLRGLEAQQKTMLGYTYIQGNNNIRTEAQRFVQQNKAGFESLVANLNIGNNPAGDIVIGYISPLNPSAPMTYSGPRWNSVRVTTYRNTSHSGRLPLLFGRILGREDQEVTATATATLTSDGWGHALPITIDIEDYKRLFDGNLDPNESDDFTYNPDVAPLVDTATGNQIYWNRVTGSKTSPAPDGVRELMLYPDKNVNVPGNFGTVDLGSLSGSTTDIIRQIKSGLNAADRQALQDQGVLTDGRLVASSLKKIIISGDPGVSWTIEKELSNIVGETRTIPVFELVNRNGTPAIYTIVGFVNVVIVEASNTPSGGKAIRVQPIAPFVIFDSPDENDLGTYIALTR